MRIGAEEFDAMRAWLAVVAPQVFPATTPETDPLAVLDAMRARAPARARAGLAMAIGDVVEMTHSWRAGKVGPLDQRLGSQGLPSLSEIRIRFSKQVQRALRRGGIRDETEYHAVRNAAEMWPERHEECWKLLAAYEERSG
jgi:hypothetical protein